MKLDDDSQPIMRLSQLSQSKSLLVASEGATLVQIMQVLGHGIDVPQMAARFLVPQHVTMLKDRYQQVHSLLTQPPAFLHA